MAQSTVLQDDERTTGSVYLAITLQTPAKVDGRHCYFHGSSLIPLAPSSRDIPTLPPTDRPHQPEPPAASAFSVLQLPCKVYARFCILNKCTKTDLRKDSVYSLRQILSFI
ncbi:hypothetical protein PUN28_013814 [Cardiocondyla obscurior]|uniref:Uncharacterized protein n=1 Tax=Cardiocondyla obscurior TaxID=286306 RepID=A0AAW2F6T6_9HYME